ncbi:universal stress protein [Ahrensia sp. R2A130]|uniref:universal stress protein n=1 Tax=Ahrensia sp. R2A130 TaxID=744979 RepID=UPI0001E09C87|nr:universal stress protein [Ahrensia sp. R2A130]EFL88380.1 UspA domain protein [Ahrensia sp. R2A130]
MVSKREVRIEGHKRKFLAVVDSTPECEKAIHYAARRVAAIDAHLVLIYVIVPQDFGHWLGVEDVMRSEGRAAADAALAKGMAWCTEFGGITPELVVREGQPAQAIEELIEEDHDIALMVLAAGDDKEGPGPLVSAIAGSSAAFSIPVTVVPATLTDEDIDDLV